MKIRIYQMKDESFVLCEDHGEYKNYLSFIDDYKFSYDNIGFAKHFQTLKEAKKYKEKLEKIIISNIIDKEIEDDI